MSIALAQTASPSQNPPVPAADRLMPLEVTINSQQGGSWTLLERNGILYGPADAFDEWRLPRRPNAVGIDYRGQTFFPLSSIPGFQARVNYANQSVELVFSPSAFAATHLSDDAPKRPVLSTVEPALFLNFDVNLTQVASRSAPSARELGALTEIGYATKLGVLTSSFVGRNLTSSDPELARSVRRLETTFTHDFPENNLTLKLGDSATRAGLWGRSYYFGGIQLTRNFGLTPGFISQPIPVLAGTSSAPSTVELYINDSLRQTLRVPSGPFVIDNFPLLTGAGQARLVVRDVLGRETVVVQPFFTNAQLLDKGLSDYSVEAGATHHNLGLNNADYHTGFASGLWRYGLSTQLTMEARGELSRQTQNAGVGVVYALPFQLLGQAAVAVSHNQDDGIGHEWVLGAERENLRHGFTVRAQGASRNYRQLGLDSSVLPNRMELSASYSYSSETRGSLGLGIGRIQTYDRGTLTSLSANYTIRLSARASLTFTATRVLGSSPGSSIGAALNVPLDDQRSLSANVTSRSGQTDAYASVSEGLKGETGLGWRTLGGSRAGVPYAEGGLLYQGNRILLSADLAASSEQQTVRLGAQGGLVFMDGQLFASRRLQDSFALVEVPGYPNVGVGFQGSSLTQTDANGKALLPRLVPYQANSIRLDPAQLPISAELDSIEAIAVPPARSGVKVVFPVRSGRGALLRIVFDDGEPAPAGATIELVGDTKEFFVARRGEAFVTGMQTKNTLRLKWNGMACTFAVELPPGSPDEIARIGPVSCAGVKR